jgi:hypothetical protein
MVRSMCCGAKRPFFMIIASASITAALLDIKTQAKQFETNIALANSCRIPKKLSPIRRQLASATPFVKSSKCDFPFG